jgi:hypothetical protein
MIDIPARHRMEYIYVIIAYNVVKDFKRICLAVKADEQVFIPRIIVIGFVQQTIVYRRVKRTPDVRFARTVFEGIGIKLNHKTHVSSIPHFRQNERPYALPAGRPPTPVRIDYFNRRAVFQRFVSDNYVRDSYPQTIASFPGYCFHF